MRNFLLCPPRARLSAAQRGSIVNNVSGRERRVFIYLGGWSEIYDPRAT